MTDLVICEMNFQALCGGIQFAKFSAIGRVPGDSGKGEPLPPPMVGSSALDCSESRRNPACSSVNKSPKVVEPAVRLSMTSVLT